VQEVDDRVAQAARCIISRQIGGEVEPSVERFRFEREVDDRRPTLHLAIPAGGADAGCRDDDENEREDAEAGLAHATRIIIFPVA
jgi:hypothetical protein